jgi:hypothetical protein
MALTAYPPSCRCCERCPGRKFGSPLRHVPDFESAYGRSNTAQPFVSFDSEAVAGDNVRLEDYHGHGAVGDFSNEAVN